MTEEERRRDMYVCILAGGFGSQRNAAVVFVFIILRLSKYVGQEQRASAAL